MRRSVTLVAGMLLVLVTACSTENAGSPSAANRPTTVPATTTTTQSASVTSAPATTPTPPRTNQPPPATVAVCTVRDLGVSLGATEGTAGTMYRALVFTNTGDRTCVIQGFPGVSFVTGDDGHQVGEAAERVGEKGPPVALKPGATATSPVGFVNIGNYEPETCQPTAVRGLRVYPPHERRSEFVPLETTGCAGVLPGSQLTVRTVHLGSSLV
jgi:uncharacterized protein DUF4232